MDTHERHVGIDFARMAVGIAALIFAISFAVMVWWMVGSEQKTKLYEADNYVCSSQPFAMQCFERKPR